jgi:hypothetical protein
MTAAATGKRLGKVLVRAGLITDEQLDSALAAAEDGRSLTAVLVDEKITTDVKIAQVVAESMGLAFVDLAGYEVDPNAAMLLASDLSRRHHVLPIKIQDDRHRRPAHRDGLRDQACRRNRERPERRDRQVRHDEPERRPDGRRHRGRRRRGRSR